MKFIHNNWRNFLAEGSFKEKKLLREITEDELEHIAKALNEMGPEDLAFNNLFDGKNRILIPFPTRDAASTLGIFVHFFVEAGWQVDWDKGIMSGTKEFEDTSPAGMADSFFGGERHKTKKMQMKIGKFLSRLKNMVDKYAILRKKAEDLKLSKETVARAGLGVYLTGNDLREHLSEEELKQYYKLYDRINGFLDNRGDLVRRFTIGADGVVGATGYADTLAQYWQQKADYIKKNLSSLDESKYSILITRHPVDVLRMSDFDDITSCHTPPSRPQDEGNYYKCAVAEAHGHGALAYVVNNSDLEEEFGTGNLIAIEKSSAFQEAQDLFYDDARDAGGEIEPVSRLRLRQVRHFKETSKWTATGRPVEEPGVQLAVPEKRVYGVKIPGLRDKVMEWVRANQEEEMLSAPTVPGGAEGVPALVNLDQFIKYGGSYEDNKINDLIRDIYDDERFGEFAKLFTGFIKQDNSTQNQLEKELTFTDLQRVQREAERVLGGYTFNHFRVSLNYEEEENEAYVVPSVVMALTWERSEWTGAVGRDVLKHLATEFTDYGDDWDIFDRGEWATRYINKDNTVLLKVEYVKLAETGPWLTLYDLEEFLDILMSIERDKIEGFKNIATRFFMNEGVVDGGEIDKLGEAVENDELDSGDWKLEVEDGDHEPHRYELVTANMPLEISYEHTTLDILKKIIEDREFWIGIRRFMTAEAWMMSETNYQVDTDRFFDEVDEVAKRLEFRLNYHIGAGDNDHIAKTWKAIIETWNDAEKLEKRIQDQFNKWVRAHGGPMVKNAKGKRMVETKLRLRNRSPEQRMFDKWRRFLK